MELFDSVGRLALKVEGTSLILDQGHIHNRKGAQIHVPLAALDELVKRLTRIRNKYDAGQYPNVSDVAK